MFLLRWWVRGWSPLLARLGGWPPVAFAAYGLDKRAAVRGGWRIPEVVLHSLALIGGVLGAWAGRLVFRHKTQHPMFLVVLVIASILWGALAIWAILGRIGRLDRVRVIAGPSGRGSRGPGRGSRGP